MPTFVMGKDCKLYHGVASAALAALTLANNVKDVTLNLTTGEADTTTRGNSGWKSTSPTLKEATVDFEMQHQPGDAFSAAVIAAWLAGTTVAMAVLTGERATSLTVGPRGNWTITNCSRSEPLEDSVKWSVTAKLETYTEWVAIP